MCVPCSANKCRIRESDLQAARLYIIFLNWYKAKHAGYSCSLSKCRIRESDLRLINRPSEILMFRRFVWFWVWGEFHAYDYAALIVPTPAAGDACAVQSGAK